MADDTSPTIPMILTILARHFAKGRAENVRLLVLHTTENPCANRVARSVATWFAGASAPEASAHYVVGPDEVVLCVPEEDTAWHAPPANPYSIGIEHTGRAAFTEADWATPEAKAMIDRSVALVADLCVRHGIPAKLVDVVGLARGDAGITTHALVSSAFHKSTHTDPGKHFPIEDYLARVALAVDALTDRFTKSSSGPSTEEDATGAVTEPS